MEGDKRASEAKKYLWAKVDEGLIELLLLIICKW